MQNSQITKVTIKSKKQVRMEKKSVVFIGFDLFPMVHTQDYNVFVFDLNNQDHMQVYVMISHLSLILLFCNIICRVVLITYTTTQIL